ncbi:hypothetical protein BGZ76_010250 [Entomortierella beljakovae]|nr:hypothetical protein BGZ76_010250 [Entomortierella beljakovae]
MLRATQSLKTKSLAAIGVSVGLLASTSGAVVFAEGKERKQKLPVYDDPEPEMVIKEEPTRLDEALRIARNETDRQILGMKYHLQVVTNKVVDLEKEAESNIKSVLVKEEEVMPAALYVVVAGFAGSVFAARRNILIRFLSPVAFSAMAFGYFFPASTNRLIANANQSDLSKYIPQDVQKQIRDLTGPAGTTESKLTKAVEEVKSSAKDVNETVQNKIQETVAAVKSTSDDAKSKATEIKKTVAQEVEKGKAVGIKTADEIEKEARIAKIKAEEALKRV